MSNKNKICLGGRIFSLVFALCIVISSSGNISYAAPTDEIQFEETVVSDNGMDNDEMFEAYVNKVLYDIPQTPKVRIYKSSILAGNSLNHVSRKLYDILKNKICTLAANGGEAKFSISYSDMGYASAGDLYNDLDNDEGLQTSSILSSLLADLPLELYWFDKTNGMNTSTSYSYSNLNGQIKEYNIIVTMAVSQAYQDKTNSAAVTNDVRKILIAKENALAVANKYKADTQKSKLRAFKNYICDAVTYDYASAEDDNTPYGDPWQLIYVFDGDDSTNVVCEGYSKAFKYLCDLSDESCYLISGKAGGPHMWNIVTLNDGKNYLVDVTNCDGSNPRDGLFLVTGTKAEAKYTDSDRTTYTKFGYVSVGGFYNLSYVYDYSMFTIYGDSLLTLSDTNANINDDTETDIPPIIYSITYELNGGTNNIQNPPTYTEGDNILLYSPQKDGYTFGGWYTDSAFSNKITTISGQNTNLTIYAKWTINQYTITYNLNGGNNNIANPAFYDVTTDTFTIKDPTKTGYTFDGWYMDLSLTEKATTTINNGSTGDKTFYAKWTIIENKDNPSDTGNESDFEIGDPVQPNNNLDNKTESTLGPVNTTDNLDDKTESTLVPVDSNNENVSDGNIDNANISNNSTVTVAEVNKNAKKVTISTVNVDGVKYAITVIAKNTFKDTKVTEVILKYSKKNITIKKDAFKKSKVKTLSFKSFTKASQIKMDKNALKSSKISTIKVSQKIYNNKKQKAALIKTLKKAGLKKYKLKKI